MTPHSHRRNWSMPPVLYRVSRGRSKMASRTAWRSVSTWADPGVRTSSTSSPWSRKRPSSCATRTARECTALLTESRSFFNVASVVMAYSLSNCSAPLAYARVNARGFVHRTRYLQHCALSRRGIRQRWPLVPELRAHAPMVTGAVFAVRTVVHHVGLVLGAVDGPASGHASRPGGTVE